jgi:hypothetical protein
MRAAGVFMIALAFAVLAPDGGPESPVAPAPAPGVGNRPHAPPDSLLLADASPRRAAVVVVSR